MILLGTPILATEARAAGLVAEIFEDTTVLQNVVAIAAKLAQASASALSLAKEAICRGESRANSTNMRQCTNSRFQRTSEAVTTTLSEAYTILPLARPISERALRHSLGSGSPSGVPRESLLARVRPRAARCMAL